MNEPRSKSSRKTRVDLGSFRPPIYKPSFPKFHFPVLSVERSKAALISATSLDRFLPYFNRFEPIMYIKQVTIHGFTSYREVSIDGLSPNINCVVGANGSGKSNFINAICFVIGDVLHDACNDHKLSILYGEAECKISLAFVEIVFDNSDRIIPVDKTEVRLRRSLSTERDEYSLDGNLTTKNVVIDLLRCAGFSASSFCYVVKQGKISSLSLMEDSGRLDLLKEISGTQVYEEYCCQSSKVLQETENERNQLREVLEFSDERLKELDELKTELDKYQQQKRVLDYCIRHKQNESTRKEVDDVNRTLSKKVDKVFTRYSLLATKEKELKRLGDSLEAVKRQSELQKEIRNQWQVAIEKQIKLGHDIKDYDEKINEKNEAEKKLLEISTKIQQSRTSLDDLWLRYDNHTTRIISHKKQLITLRQKQDHVVGVTSTAGCNERLKQQVFENCQKVQASINVQLTRVSAECGELRSELEVQQQKIRNNKEPICQLKARISELLNNGTRKNLENLHQEQKKFWDTEDKLTADIHRYRTDLVKARKSLDRATPGDIRRGLRGFQKLRGEHNLSGVYGSIIEFLRCEEKFYAAVEVTAGNRLFDIVVDTDETSNKVKQHLNAQGSTGLKFIHLDRAQDHVIYPEILGATSLTSHLKFITPECAQAADQVFGRTMICDNFDAAINVARCQGFVGITYEGAQAGKQTDIKGGVYDESCSKLKLTNTIQKLSASIEEAQTELSIVESKLQDIDRRINEDFVNQQKEEDKLDQWISELKHRQQDVANANECLQDISQALQRKGSLNKILTTIVGEIDAITQQRETETGPSVPVEGDLASLISNAEEELKTLWNEREKIEADKVELDCQLRDLVRWEQKLEAGKQCKEEVDALNAKLIAKREELSSAGERVKELKNCDEDVSAKIATQCNEQKKFNIKDHEVKSLLEWFERILGEESAGMLYGKLNSLLERLELLSKKAAELPALSSDEMQMQQIYMEKDQGLLHLEWCVCSEKFELLNNAYKAALDEYESIKHENEEFKQQQKDCVDANTEVKEYLSALHRSSEKSVETTFKYLDEIFREVFSVLVEGGYGSLTLVERKDNDRVDKESCEYKYIGLEVKVLFPEHKKVMFMRQLTGGQKKLVSLALIFAIQKLDPAPFLFLDEIDAIVESQYQSAVANMVRQFSDETRSQIIMTACTSQMTEVAQRIYHVEHKNQSSFNEAIDKQKANTFLFGKGLLS